MVIGEVTMGVFYLASYLNCCSVLQSILKNVDIHLNRAQVGRQKPLNCLCEGLLVNYKSDFEFCYFAVHFWESFCFTYFKIILHICNVSPLSRTQTSSRKHSEVLELIILWALVTWFVCSALKALSSFSFRTWQLEETACVTTAFSRISFAG